MSYVQPADLVDRLIAAGASKSTYSAGVTVLRAVMGGAILTLGAAFAVTVSVQTGSPLLGAMLFPVGFIVLYLMGYDLITGVFTLVPLALIARRPGVTVSSMLRVWGLVFLGNFLGAIAVAVLMAIVVTYGFSTPPNEVGMALREIGHGRTVGYADHGAAGMLTLFLRGVLCNWMVSTGVVGAFMADSILGKALCMWMPVMLFFFMGFEHSVVNMFLFPSGLLLGADFTLMDYLIWNEIPTIAGNLVGGLALVGLPLYFAHGRRGAAGTAGTTLPVPSADAVPTADASPVDAAPSDETLTEQPALTGAPR